MATINTENGYHDAEIYPVSYIDCGSAVAYVYTDCVMNMHL